MPEFLLFFRLAESRLEAQQHYSIFNLLTIQCSVKTQESVRVPWRVGQLVDGQADVKIGPRFICNHRIEALSPRPSTDRSARKLAKRRGDEAECNE